MTLRAVIGLLLVTASLATAGLLKQLAGATRVASSSDSIPYPERLAYYLPFDSDLQDDGTNGFTAAMAGTGTVRFDGTSVVFNGGNYLMIPSNAVTYSSFTIFVRGKQTTLDGFVKWMYWAYTGLHYFSMGRYASGSSFVISQGVSNTVTQWSLPVTAATDKYYVLATSYTNNSANFYVDGVLVGSDTSCGLAIFPSASSNWLGNFNTVLVPTGTLMSAVVAYHGVLSSSEVNRVNTWIEAHP